MCHNGEMKQVVHFFERGSVLPAALVATAFVGALVIFSHFLFPTGTKPVADMRIEPQHGVVTKDGMFTVEIVVESKEPVNVFNGELRFDNEILEVESIDYNTSIADLWAEKPWFENGEGTLNFTGGSTDEGGFLGTGPLITVHFKALGEGDGTLVIYDAHILKHDGLGSFAKLEEPIDALFDVESDAREKSIMPKTRSAESTYKVVAELPSTDLNGDGRQSITDVSIFMLNLAGSDPRYDFNLDGKVNAQDLSILMDAR